MTVHRIPLEGHETVVSVLREAATQNADLEAYVEPRQPGGTERRAMTFAQWDRRADGVAGALVELGVAKGDVVCLLLPSSIDYAVLYAALLRLGAITSGINPRLGRAEVDSIVSRAQPVLIIHEPEAVHLVEGGPTRLIERARILRAVDGEPPKQFPALSAHDPVAVVWTSGTTGMPKGALFDHANLAAVAAGIDVLSEPGDRRLSPLPFAHVGYMTRAWDEIAHGVTTVITPTPWRAEDAVRILEEERITVAQGVPTQWALMMETPAFASADFSHLRIAGTGAARMAATQVAALRERLGVPVVVRYTSTESSLGTGTTLSTSDEEVATTVGRPVPGVELAIVNDDGAELAAGEIGRVRLRSGATMRGYWGQGPGRGKTAEQLLDPVASAMARLPEGWIETGDFGWLNPLGNLVLSGRAHERYIRGGYNVYPAEVEQVLMGHPAVARVAVVGAPDDVLGEIGVAVVVPEGDEIPELSSLRSFCRERLSDYKAPDAVVVVDELPLTPMMKVDPHRIAALAELGAQERRERRAADR